MTTSDPASPASGPTERKPRLAAVVYHPHKGHIKAMRRAVAAAEREAGWAKTLWLPTTAADAGRGMARKAIAAGAEVVVAAGGDGTVRSVAEAVHGSSAVLALMPSGTGNLLARNMHAPLDDLEASAAAVFSGEDRAIDFGDIVVERAGGKREQYGFVVMAGLGLDARMLANTRPGLKRRVGWLAYVDAIARSLRDAASIEFRYRLDDEPTRSLRAHTLIVGNCGTLQANMLLLPDAEIDDGVFDVVALRPRSMFGWLRIGAHVLWENALLRRWRSSRLAQTDLGKRIVTMSKTERPLRYMRGEQLIVRLEHADEFEVDGDSIGRVVAFNARVDKGGLIVRVAPQTTAKRARGRR